jgi:lysophospholipase L1-like esterase
MPTSLTVGLLLLAVGLAAAEGAPALGAGFAAFDRKATAGEPLTVVFFGCSLTWGSNASDPDNTSYRAVVRDHLERHYPKARFRCRDSAIGGTGSQLGVFRLERDVLRWKPDLVFVDFTANDDIYSQDPENLASYEAILAGLAQAGIPAVQVAFPFKWNVARAELPKMHRLAAHRALAETYGNGWGDAVTRTIEGVEAGTLRIADLWVADGVHPYDPGYQVFGDAAWDGFLAAVAAGRAPRLPAQPVHPITYRTAKRVHLASLGTPPSGWTAGIPHRTACFFDFVMSRWLDDLLIGRNRAVGPAGADGKPTLVAQEVAPLRLRVEAATVLLFGEASPESGTFRILVDGAPLLRKDGNAMTEVHDANRWKAGNGHLVIELARGLDPAVPHLIEIQPLFDDADRQLRIESICVAGGKATVEWAR